MMAEIAKKHFPCLTYGFAVMILIIAGSFCELGYESFPGALYNFFLIPVMGFMFWFPNEILSSLNVGLGIAGERIISFGIGLTLCIITDVSFQALKQRRKKK